MVTTSEEYSRKPFTERLSFGKQKELKVTQLLIGRGVSITSSTRKEDMILGIDGWYYSPGHKTAPQSCQIKFRSQSKSHQTDLLYEVIRCYDSRLQNIKRQCQDNDRVGRDYRSIVQNYFLLLESNDYDIIYQIDAILMKKEINEALSELVAQNWNRFRPFQSSHQIQLRPTTDPCSREKKLMAFIPLTGKRIKRKWTFHHGAYR